MIFKQDQNYWAVFYANEEALIVQTCSGLGLTAIDHLYPPPYPAIGYRQWNLRHNGLTSVSKQQDIRQRS